VSKRGYLILGLLFLGLIVYLAWPDGKTGPSTFDILEARPTAGFTVRTARFEQVVSGDGVIINGIERSVDPAKVDRLWGTFERMASVHPPLAPAGSIEAYGISGDSPRVTAAGIDFTWGVKDQTLWLYDASARLLYRFEIGLAGQLQAIVDRLDQPTLLPDLQPAALVVDDQSLVGTAGPGGVVSSWSFVDAPNRPPATGRVSELLSALRSLSFTSFAGELPAGASQAHRIVVTDEAGAATELTVHTADGRAWVVLADLPPQDLPAGQLAVVQRIAGTLSQDLLFDMPVAPGSSPIESVSTHRAGVVVFEAERGDLGDTNNDGDSTWELRWSGGRETASADVGQRFLDACARLPVSEAKRRALPLRDPPIHDGPTVVTLSGYLPGGGLWLQIDGDHVATAEFTARALDLPELLRDLNPGSALSRELLRRPPARISRVQRVIHDQGQLRVETLRRGSGGWTLRRLAGPADALERGDSETVGSAAVRRLVGAVVLAAADSVRLATPADLDIRSDPARRELAVRIDPMTIDKANDIDRVEETAIRDWALAMRRGEGGWDAIDFDGTLAYRLSDALVAEWFADLRSKALLAVQPSRVDRAVITPFDAEDYVLAREGEAWWVEVGERRFPADAASVRAWIGELARMEALSIDPDGLALAPDGPRQGLLELSMPGYAGALDRIELVVGVLAADGVPVSTGNGRAVIDPSQAARLLPTVGTFLSPSDLEALRAE
jgi:hypothetical protein